MERDSKIVIGAITRRMRVPWILATSFEAISFKHIFRDANFVADKIANLGHSCNRDNVWTDRVPDEVRNVLLFDVICNGCPIIFSI